MSIKKKSLQFALCFFLSLNAFGASFSSFEEFVAWERNLKLNASFHKDYKVPDYIRVALMDSGPESAYSRYLFFKNNPQYASDFESIHKGQLSTQTTDGTTIIKSSYDNMPPEIAEYYKKNPAELLAAEGFGHDPVLARKLYTGELQLDKNINKSNYLRNHAWTPNGIVERNNVVEHAKAEYSGGYKLNKYDPATGKIIENTTGGNGSQLQGHFELLKTIQRDMEIIVSKAQVIRESIALSLKTSDNAPESLDCSGQVPTRYKGRCNELLVLIKGFAKLESNAEKVRGIITGIDNTIGFPKIALDSSAVKSAVVAKSSKNVFAADEETPNCTLPVQAGWKCLKTSVTTLEGKKYNILLKWNRPLKKSKGTVFFGIGGAGMGESLEDAPSKAVMDQLDQIDQIRIVALEMLDPNPQFPLAGGYWTHGGGYDTLAQIFMATMDLAVKKSLLHGNFTNYLGGSNGTMLLASAMARYNADAYFDRVVFQMGPFLPNLAKACDKNSASSFYLSNQQQFDMTQDFLSRWTYSDPAKKVCDNLSVDRNSLLKEGFKKDYPNTIIHVIMGEKEVTEGFGKWILASNLEWYNSINAKYKERILRPYMGHNNSYEDMRRFLKLAPNENPDRSLEQCRFGTFRANGGNYEYSCGCGTVAGGVLQGDGCFHKAASK